MKTTKRISHTGPKRQPKPTTREARHAQKYQPWKRGANS